MAGKYDDLAEELLRRTRARGVMVLVIEGQKGTGLSFGQNVEFDLSVEENLISKLPEMLHKVADKIAEENKQRDSEAV